jgi:hypothetical protein
MSEKWKGVRGGTPLHGKSLCDSCRNAHIVKGTAESERLVVCEAQYYRPERVPFQTVVECTSFRRVNMLSLNQMEKMAYIIETDPRGKPIGFKPNNQFRKDQGLDRDDDLTPGLAELH